MKKGKKLYEGKAKVIFATDNKDFVIQHFKDDATAFNNQKKAKIEGKGVLNNRISEHILMNLDQVGIKNHLVKRLNMREQLIKHVEIIPIEFIVRNIATGSLTKRLGIEDGTILEDPLIEYCLKNDELGDPLVSKEHLESVKSYINMAKEEGSRLILDGRDLIKRKNSDSGYFLGPTLIDNVKTNMDSYKNEIFGPVLQIIEINKMSEAIKIINDNEFGNGCCIFTSNGESARNFSQNAQIGMVGVNIPLPVPSSYHSFGGWKNSLFGDLSIYGPDGVRFYTQRKTITQRWPNSSSKSGGIDLSMPNNLKQ